MDEQKSILIVEEESIVAMELERRLRGLGYAIAAVTSSGEEAIEKVEQIQPDLVLMDIRLQGEMDGVKAAQHIQARLDVPVIYLTTYADDETLQRAKVRAPFGYLLKPFDERSLHITIEMALSQHGIEKQLKDRERWLVTTLRSIGEAVIATDTHGRVMFLNPAAEQLTGWERHEALGEDIREVFRLTNNGDGSPAENPVITALHRGAAIFQNNDSVLLSRDGNRRPISESAAPIRDEHGNLSGVVLVFNDVSERQRAAKEMETRLQRIQRHQSALVRLSTMESLISGNFQRAAEEITEIVAGAMEVERVSIWLMSDDGRELQCADLFQRTHRRHTKGATLRMAEYPTYFQAVKTWRAVDAQDARADARTREFTAGYLVPNDIYSMLDSGIRVCGSLVGVVCHENVGATRAWSTEETAFAGEVADQVAQVIQSSKRKQAEEELRQSYEKVKRLLEQTVNVLASTVEMRDPYTAGHQRRVAVLACAIAEEMDLPEEQVDGIRMAAMIHDIGKIYVPAEILSKPGRLTPTELKLIQTHPQTGYDLLKKVDFPWPVAQIVLEHHERMDGSGFPSGVSGEQVLLEARILAVADVVEAMSSHRPYRPAYGVNRALEEISGHKNTLYDSRVVEACLRLFYKREFRFE